MSDEQISFMVSFPLPPPPAVPAPLPWATTARHGIDQSLLADRFIESEREYGNGASARRKCIAVSIPLTALTVSDRPFLPPLPSTISGIGDRSS